MAVLLCGACKKQMQVPDSVLGQAVKCPACGQVVQTRAPAAPQPVAVAPQPVAVAPQPVRAAAPPQPVRPAVQPQPVKSVPPPQPVKAVPPSSPAGPFNLDCSFCGGRIQATAEKAGQTINCPTCDTAMTLPGKAPPAPAATKSPAAPPPVAPAPAVAPVPVQPQVITFACQKCQCKIKVAETMAGKGIKCPKCAQVVKVPTPAPAPVAAAPIVPAPAKNGTAAAVWGPEWIEVNVSADGKAPAPVPAGGGVTGDWGEKILEGKDIPEPIHSAIKGTLTRNERLLWADRPMMEILMDQARRFRLVTLCIAGPISLLALGVMIYFTFINWQLVGLLVPLFFLAIGGIMIGYALKAPGMTLRNANNRATYLLTNRRVIVHAGVGMQFFSAGGSAAADIATGQLTPFTGPEILKFRRHENKKYEGAGDLYLGRTSLEEMGGFCIMGIAKVREVEKLFRQKLINPLVDKLLSGQKMGGEDQAALNKERAAEAKDDNLKDAPGVISARSAAGKDPNLKDAPGVGRGAAVGDDNLKEAPASVLERDLKKVPKDLREQVQDELTEGEKILWIGEPEAEAKGRGFFGAITGGAKRIEPAYTLYAITNRRALVWDKDEAPHSYYSPHLSSLGYEEDKRVKNGGNVLFKVVKLTITTTTTDKKGRSSTSTRVEMHYFGFMHVRNYRMVGRLLYETLLEPLAD